MLHFSLGRYVPIFKSQPPIVHSIYLSLYLSSIASHALPEYCLIFSNHWKSAISVAKLSNPGLYISFVTPLVKTIASSQDNVIWN